MSDYECEGCRDDEDKCIRDGCASCCYCKRPLIGAPPAPDDRYRKVTVLRDSSVWDNSDGKPDSIHTLEPITDHKGARGEHRMRLLDAEFFPPGVQPDTRGTFTITVEFTPDAEEKP